MERESIERMARVFASLKNGATDIHGLMQLGDGMETLFLTSSVGTDGSVLLVDEVHRLRMRIGVKSAPSRWWMAWALGYVVVRSVMFFVFAGTAALLLLGSGEMAVAVVAAVASLVGMFAVLDIRKILDETVDRVMTLEVGRAGVRLDGEPVDARFDTDVLHLGGRPYPLVRSLSQQRCKELNLLLGRAGEIGGVIPADLEALLRRVPGGEHGGE